MRRSKETTPAAVEPDGAQSPAQRPEAPLKAPDRFPEAPLKAPDQVVRPAILDLRSPPSHEPDRWTLLWRAKVWVALATIAAGGIAYVASSRITPSYQASSLVQVSAHPQTGISPQDIATASNELAAQLAQLTRTAPVLEIAAQSQHDAAGAIGQHVVAVVLANQNLIQITAQNTTPASTRARATAVAGALQGYISAQGASAAGSASPPPPNPQLAAIDAQLAAAQADAAKAEAAAATSYPGSASIAVAAQKASFVQQLQLQRNTLAMQLDAADATSRPTVRVLGEASAAVKIQPRPMLYAGVTLVIAALLAGQLSVFVGSRQHLKDRATSSSGQ